MIPRRIRSIVTVSMAMLGLVLAANTCFAQASASVTGLVADPNGAVVPAATVVLVNKNTKESRTAAAGADGRYSFPLLLPGTYELAVEAPGFKKAVVSNISLSASQAAEENVHLELGAVAETVEVQGTSVALDTQSADQSTSLDQRQIQELPVNYRNPMALVFTTAGVKSMISQTGIRSPQETFLDGDMGLFAMNGGREGSNTVWVNGITAKAGDWGQTLGTPQVDAVQEVQVLRNTYDAQYGRIGNGVVNLITKGGSPDFHGSAFEYLRNQVLDANRWEYNRAGVAKTPLKRNQFGGTVAGPLWKKRNLFFLFGTEYNRLNETLSSNITVPTALQRQGDFSKTLNGDGSLQVIYDPLTTRANPNGAGFLRSPFPNNVIPANRMDPVGNAVTNKLFPVATSAGNPITGGLNFFGAGRHAQSVNRFDGRADWARTSSHSMFLHITRNMFDEIQPRIFKTGVEDSAVSPHGGDRGGPDYQITFSNTIVPSPTWAINVVVGAGGITSFSYGTSVQDNVPLTSLGYSQGFQNQFPVTSVGAWNITNFVNMTGGGKTDSALRTGTLAANITHEHNAHSIKFGFAGTNYVWNPNGRNPMSMAFNSGPTTGPVAASASSVSGNSIASLLLGLGTGSFTTPFAPATTYRELGWYVQDSWKASRKLTLTLGLRYELQLPMTERYNRLNYFDPTITSPLAAPTGLPLKGGLAYLGDNNRGETNTDFTNFAPRIGVAYKVTEKLVVRSGYGVSYGRSLTESGINGTNGYTAITQWVTTPNGVTPTVFLSNPFPQGLNQPTGSTLGAATFAGLTPTAWRRDNPSPLIQSYSIDFQYQLGQRSIIEVGYTGNVGRRLAYGVVSNANQLDPKYLSQGQALNNLVPNPFLGTITTGALANPTIPAYQLLLPYPQFINVNNALSTKGAISNFNALTAKFMHRFSTGLTLLTTYQWSKALDTSSEDQGWWLADGRRDVYNPNSDYSISAHDVPQDLVNTLVYELPVGKGRKFGSGMNTVADAVLGGWEVSGVVRFASGIPLGLYAQNTLSAFGFGVQRPKVANVNDLSLANRNPDQWFNTSAATAPGLFEIGNAPRFIPNVRQQFMNNSDLSLLKNFKLGTERVKGQFKVQAFNAFNHPLFGIATGNNSGPAPAETVGSPSFGKVTSTFITGSRNIQLGLKLSF
jgi:hypothetical protein